METNKHYFIFHHNISPQLFNPFMGRPVPR